MSCPSQFREISYVLPRNGMTGSLANKVRKFIILF